MTIMLPFASKSVFGTKRRGCRPRGAALLVTVMGAALASSGWTQPGTSSLPDPRLTPGDVLPVTAKDVCTRGYSGRVRDVPQAVKEQVYRNYGILSHAPRTFEVDHLISLELGGSNSIKNLWPESYLSSPWNAHVKDQLEDELHRLVCSGQITLATAQRDIAGDWITAYKRYFHTTLPLSKSGGKRGTRRTRQDALPAATPAAPRLGLKDRLQDALTARRTRVWVNTASGKYFYAGSRYYGHTKQGEYLTEAQARQQGYTAAK